MSVSTDPSKSNTAVPSGRKGSAKVRSGCITCKARKVKCDEGKPSCLRCLKSGRSCDGYLDPSVMASRRRSIKNRLADTGGPSSPLSTLLDGAMPEEKRSFHFFQYVTAPNLAGDLDANFWKVLVLQVCQTEPAVRHAVLAVSGLHEYLAYQRGYLTLQNAGRSTTEHMNSEPQHSFALHQYNKAIACLIGQMKDTTSRPLAPLLTCVLFVCLEFMHGKDKESLIHLEQGRQLLSKLDQRADSKDPEIDIVKRHLVPLYLRLSLTAFLLGGKPVPIPQSLKSLKEVPATFESVQEIRFSLYDFIDEVLRYSNRTRMARYDPVATPETLTELKQEKEGLLQRLTKLSVAFALYQASKPSQVSEVNAAVFHMYLHIMTIWVSTALSNTEACFDDHLSSFSAIIPHAAVILNHSDDRSAELSLISRNRLMQERLGEGDLPKRQNCMFTFETYVIPVLYYVATKCRHPLIRHSALDLLKQNPNRRENLWHAKKMAAIAEHVVRVEERSAAESEPGSPIGQHPLGNGSDPFRPFHPPMLLMHRDNGSQTSESVVGYGDTISPTDPFVPTQLLSTGLESSSPASDDYTCQSLSLNNNNAPRQQNIIHMQNRPTLPIDPSMIPALSVEVENSFSTEPSYMSQGEAALLAGLEGSSNGRHGVNPSAATDTFCFLAPAQQPPQQHLHSVPPSRTPSVISRGSHGQTEDWPYSHERYRSQQQRTISTSSGSDSSGSSPELQALLRFDSGLGHYSGYWQSHLQHGQPAASRARPFASLEAPFDIPEHMRVHDVIINPERDDGSWLTVFRKLHGPAAEWDVATELVVA
ncbi:hypothetical protein MCOR08_006067 [Pyricularia oryzae]|nr:hypothetical protein MCOR10_005520 [Pyricularia oryzae]KAI6541990.1 hypothetical protein MCOR05_003780 [Pyricularia oryzae]KAI6598926.1 hypothetical protein MCOR12_005197 [Pyricularia oryzae]KAI6630802.1 hypothetical protein MCOR08_006067 [Pyricularia oryzae]